MCRNRIRILSFCTVGEEQGFLGASAVLIVFGLFILRLIVLAERQDNAFGRVYGYSVASIFFFHLAINVGMVTGLTPVIGIPLPFFSYWRFLALGIYDLIVYFSSFGRFPEGALVEEGKTRKPIS